MIELAGRLVHGLAQKRNAGKDISDTLARISKKAQEKSIILLMNLANLLHVVVTQMAAN